MTIEGLFVASYVLTAAVSLWSLAQLKRFLAETHTIADDVSLSRFKALARLQMYLALVVIVLMIGGFVAGMAVIARHGLPGGIVVILTNVLVLGLGMYHKRFEVKTRSLPAGSDALAAEYRRVSEAWVKKPLPDF
jgi:hypothetical protein